MQHTLHFLLAICGQTRYIDIRNLRNGRFCYQTDIDGLDYHLMSNYICRPVAAHVAAMDRRDIYVSVVTSLNTWFGSKVRRDQDRGTL